MSENKTKKNTSAKSGPVTKKDIILHLKFRNNNSNLSGKS